MDAIKTEDILSSIVDILRHIEGVQSDIKELSEKSGESFCRLLEVSGVQPDDEMIKAFQYQDIISQQITAVNDAIASIDKNIEIYLKAVKEDRNMLSDSMEKLSTRLIKSLETAKEKKTAFMGNAKSSQSGAQIEFFD